MLVLSFVIAIAGGAITILFLLLLLRSKPYRELLEPLKEKDFPFKELYGAGFAFLDMIKYPYRGRLARRLYEEAKILYNEKYAIFYVRVTMAQCVSLTMLVLAVGLPFSMLVPNSSDQPLIAALIVVAAAVVFYYYSTRMQDRIKKQSDRYLGQFPEVVSKLALLISSGMMLREAWATIAFSSDADIYQLMRTTSDDIDNGQSEGDAYYHFGVLCGVQEIRKFISMLVQNLNKGTADLALILAQQSKEMWETKRQLVLRKGELAASKLMIPIGLMFIGVLVIVIVPIVTSMNL